MLKKSRKILFGLLFFFLCASTYVNAAEFKVEYGLSLRSIPVGKAKLFGTISTPNYQLSTSIKLTGLAGVFVAGNGTAASTGVINQGKLLPSEFNANGQVQKKQHTIQIRYAKNTANTTIFAPHQETASDRVAVEARHKQGTVDPLSVLLAPISGNANPLDPENCKRTLPVFDGGARHLLSMDYMKTQNANLSAYKGQVLVCSIRYTAVAGHRPNRKGVKFMEKNKDMQIWYAFVPETQLLIPVHIHVATPAGVAEANLSLLKTN